MRFDGADLLGPRSGDRCAPLRGTRMGLVFQDPMNALTPHLTIGRQLAELVLDRGLLDATAARARALEVLRAVRIAGRRKRACASTRTSCPAASASVPRSPWP